MKKNIKKRVFSRKINNSFTIGINDDVSFTSIDFEKYKFNYIDNNDISIKLRGMGGDGMVGVSKNTIKILGENTENFVQGYFQYDSKKANGVTISHLRISKNEIKSTYLIQNPNIVVIAHMEYIHRYDILKGIKKGGIVIFNSSLSDNFFWKHLTKKVQKTILEKQIEVYVVDASGLAKNNGLGNKISTAMQASLFKSIESYKLGKTNKTINFHIILKEQIKKMFGNKGINIIEYNNKIIDFIMGEKTQKKDFFYKLDYYGYEVNGIDEKPIIPQYKMLKYKHLPEGRLEDIIIPCMKLEGDKIPVSKMSFDGSIPTGTSGFDIKIGYDEIPVWNKTTCIECTFCSIVCPHNAIFSKQVPEKDLEKMGEEGKIWKEKGIKKEINGENYYFYIQINPEQCTGCGLCVDNCPMKNSALTMKSRKDIDIEQEQINFEMFDKLPGTKKGYGPGSIQNSQLSQSYFLYSGACAGCGETPVIKLLTQLFGPNLLIANATGCSSIYGGTFPNIPWVTDQKGNGPAWANSLFEDNAEFGLGIHLSKTFNTEKSKSNEILWIIGGDGWAYDIGFGGLDHVVSTGQNINILILDTQGYANTGGQCSKATPIGVKATFAKGGKKVGKKDIGRMLMQYESVYVASINLGANNFQAIQALQEAVDYNGPSVVIAYSTCIAHGIDMGKGNQLAKEAVNSGFWPLYRYNPDLKKEGKDPMQWDGPKDKNEKKIDEFKNKEKRFK